MNLLRELAANLRDFVAAVGATTNFLGRVLGQTPGALLRPVTEVFSIALSRNWVLIVMVRRGLRAAAKGRRDVAVETKSKGLRMLQRCF